MGHLLSKKNNHCGVPASQSDKPERLLPLTTSIYVNPKQYEPKPLAVSSGYVDRTSTGGPVYAVLRGMATTGHKVMT
jgi:hypothetical protein